MQSAGGSRQRRRFGTSWLVAAVVVAMVSLAGCSSGSPLTIPGTDPLLTVESRGGLCAAGPCDQIVTVDRSGHAHVNAKPPNELGTVSAERYAALESAIVATDFAALRSHPFGGVCPIAFDGQELVFTFATVTGPQRIASCETAIDWGSPLFAAVGAAIGEWVPVPIT